MNDNCQRKDPIDYYQAIADELVEIIHEPWQKTVVDVERSEDSIGMTVIYTRIDGSEESDVDVIMLPRYFFELANVISNPGKGLYKRCKFVLEKSGEYDISFEY